MARAVPYQHDEIDELIHSLRRPVYVLNMAKGRMAPHMSPDEIVRSGAVGRANGAKKDIRRILREWLDDKPDGFLES